MRVTIVGGTRFIGPAIARALLARGHGLTLVHRGVHPCELAGVEVIAADRSDPVELRAAVARSRPEVVVDTRSMTEADARSCAQAAEGCPVVVLSSQDVYAQFGRLNGLPAPEPEELIREDSPLSVPFPFRGIAEHAGGADYDKKLVEAVYAAAVGQGLPAACVLRLPGVYGRRDPARRFGFILDALDAGRSELPRVGAGAFRWTHAHVDDVGHAVALAAEHLSAGYEVYNVGEAEPPTLSERAEALAAAAGHSFTWAQTDALEGEWGLLGTMPNDVVCDTRRLRERLGFSEVTTLASRLEDTIAGLRASRA